MMHLYEKEIIIPVLKEHRNLLFELSDMVFNHLAGSEIPIRFVITKTDDNSYCCELGVLSCANSGAAIDRDKIFAFKKREGENVDEFTAVLIVPTGIGAEIGGHSGDAGAVARLVAASCDNLITHPNVVNASDINELPENGLYVEGSVITRLLMGTVGLQRVRSNRVLLVVDKHDDRLFYESAINAASAARSAMGINCPKVIIMDDKMSMRSLYSSSGRAVGRIDDFNRVCELLEERRNEYDAVALSSVIRVPERFHKDYYVDDMINPWGGVEAMLTHTISLMFEVPSAHSPMLESRSILDLELGVVDPRKAAEIISVTFLHSVLKGLHKSPRIVSSSTMSQPNVLTATDVSCLIIPDGCVGLPTLAALEQGIPVIAVRENRNHMENKLENLPFLPGKLFMVDNYLEAIGVISAMKAGVDVSSVRRPLDHTVVSEYRSSHANYIMPVAQCDDSGATKECEQDMKQTKGL
jgi:hypothetical protein